MCLVCGRQCQRHCVFGGFCILERADERADEECDVSASCAPNHVLHEVLLRPSDIALGLQRPGYGVEHVVFLKMSEF